MPSRICDACGRSFQAQRAVTRFCSPACRMRYQRSPDKAALVAAAKAAAAVAPPEPDVSAAPSLSTPGPVFRTTREALQGAGREDTPLGAAAMTLAGRIDTGERETGAALAALVRQHQATLAEALKGAGAAANPLDELRARRDSKRAAG